MASNRLEDLDIYNLAMKLGEEVWSIALTWDGFARDTIGKQLVRSADSIASSIAEGHGRFSYKERRQFLYFSRGSLQETKSWLQKARLRALINPQQHEKLIEDMQELHLKANAFIKSIKRQLDKKT